MHPKVVEKEKKKGATEDVESMQLMEVEIKEKKGHIKDVQMSEVDQSTGVVHDHP